MLVLFHIVTEIFSHDLNSLLRYLSVFFSLLPLALLRNACSIRQKPTTTAMANIVLTGRPYRKIRSDSSHCSQEFGRESELRHLQSTPPTLLLYLLPPHCHSFFPILSLCHEPFSFLVPHVQSLAFAVSVWPIDFVLPNDFED